MTRNSDLSPQTKAAQALHMLDRESGAVVPAMHSASTFARDENYELRDGFVYSRYGSPTTRQGEDVIAALEDADETLLFNSGMSATVAVVEALPVGAHVVAQSMMYHVGLNWLQRQAARGVIGLDAFEAGNLQALKAAIKPGKTKLVWIETPANGDWSVTDIVAAADMAHAAGAILMCDSTAAPPCTTRPLELGADISFHSATKYLNGHSDLTAGVLSARSALPVWEEIRNVRGFQGTTLPGFEAWLLIRGLRTLYIRYKTASDNAMQLAQHFEGADAIDCVLYPGLPSHAGHAIAARQMTGGYGGMMSLLVAGPKGRALAIAKACKVFIPATSLGGVESLIEHRMTVSGEGYGIPENLLRLSIGIEHVDDLIADLEQAIAQTA
ncbi:MAG: PLP-dependent aspartate aminotransferase family protein [Rhodobacteraceae bacterium]|nr:PLP-dependent aspartate aminotransferase family protein [Paracoccaceae bacterium]